MNRRFKPFSLKTSNIFMRPHQKGDETLLNNAVRESFKELHHWMDWAKNPQTMEETLEYINHTQNCWKNDSPDELPMLIFDREEKKLIGSSGYHSINWNVPMLEIGYWVNANSAGKGYITEATNVLTQFAFSSLNAKRVEIRCDSENVKSLSIPKRLGYEIEAHFKNHRIQPATGHLSGTLVFVRYDIIGMPEIEYELEYL